MLRLTALDAEDLAVISAHMQDAVLQVGDMKFDPSRKQFALVANRFGWDRSETPQRRRAGLHFDRVISVQSHRIRMAEKDAVLALLAVSFRETDAPSGEVLLTFSGGGAIRLIVECLECQMKDLGLPWSARHMPQHDLGGGQS